MKAITYTKYGSPDVLHLTEVAKPTPNDNEILVKIQDTIVTPTDVAMRTGSPFLIRFFAGLFKPKGLLGTDLAGEVVAIGKDVNQFKVGDRIFGASIKSGAYAEYITLPQDGVVATIPVNRTVEDMAGICDGAMTALLFLRDEAKVQTGQKVLINGASGSVGSYAVQLAKHFGAEVTGVCSTRNVELVKSLGADHVIDYTQDDFTHNAGAYDVIFDAVGKSSFPACKNALTDNGIYLTTVPSLGIIIHMLATMISGSKKARFAATGPRFTQKDLLVLREMLEEGTLRTVIDRRYPLAEIVEAHRYVEAGHKVGSVVITVRSENGVSA